MKNNLLLVISFSLLVLFDQLTKLLADSSLVLGQPVKVIDGLFNFTLVYNKGVAFGMMAGWSEGVRIISISIVSVLALSLVAWMYWSELKYSRLGTFTCSMILAGAFGNIIDRVRIGKVIDFLDFYWQDLHWPAFNLADSYICVAVAVLVVVNFSKHKPENKVNSD